MMCYKDMTFCAHYWDCKKADECPRPLTPEVISEAHKANMPIARFGEQPDCWEAEDDLSDMRK